MRRFACLVAASVISLPLHAQTPTTTPPRPADVASLDAILSAIYDVISGPAGERDWDRFRSLFVPEARLIPTRRLEDARWVPDVLTVDEFIQLVDPQFRERPFYEDELHRVVEQFGHVVHVFSTYASRRAPGEAPFSRGINSMQLFHDGVRWWCVSIMWDAERDGQTIPPRYLGPPTGR